MRLLKYLLTALTGFAAATAVAYFMYERGTGVFTVLPDGATDFLMRHSWLQYVAVGFAAVFLLANLVVISALKRQKTDNRV